ncbi:DUF4190 domain-containing protein [Demequina sp. NBRC 110052]|uniref:DUF4190 domain-containing protein n=1 Tax=Demequina sp. NBRC 110052 TaxID=1570341 RepID=UPI0009FFCCA2|nr:DUF4190 domain-containing protein [Demequina sp. NBRC 110052]
MGKDRYTDPNDPWVAPPLDDSQPQQWAQPLPAQPAAAPPGQSQGYDYAAPPTGQPYGAGPTPAQGFSSDGQGYGTPYGTGPYGAAPYGYAQPPRTDKDWMGIASLVTSLLGISLLGVIFGHLGLKANRNGEANNRGIALAGTVIGWVGVIGTVLFVGMFAAAAVFASIDEANGSAGGDTAVEDFYEDPFADEPPVEETPAWAEDLALPGDGIFGEAEADSYFVIWVDGVPDEGTCLAPSLTAGYDLDVVGCDEGHVAEVFVSFSLGTQIQGDDPYSDESWDHYEMVCDSQFLWQLGDDAYDGPYSWWVFAASEDADPTPDDTLLCVLSEDFSWTTGSVLEGNQSSGGQNL